MTMTLEEIENVVEEFESYIDNKPVRYGDQKLRADMRKLEALALQALHQQWRPIESVPDCLPGSYEEVIVCVQSEQTGKRYRYAACYLRDYEFAFDSEPGIRKVTGFYYPEIQEEGAPFYRVGGGESIFIGWAPLPQPPESEVG